MQVLGMKRGLIRGSWGLIQFRLACKWSIRRTKSPKKGSYREGGLIHGGLIVRDYCTLPNYYLGIVYVVSNTEIIVE